ncbi:MAG: DUF4838 domain-containing protein [Ruminococcaceae bacterium]|nr:DUF4838 domain-containing protein [Oscillospiraceae bacterium]
MKKIVSFILAAILLLSAFTSCAADGQKETDTAAETASPEMAEDGALYIAENGEAKAHIVLSENADELERYAAEELSYHIKKVSGAEVSVGAGEGTAIIIGTPDSVPELAELFPEDIAWLSETEDADGKRWSDDGFAIRREGNRVYVFGVTPRGALNGAYELIEENMGVLWIRSDEDYGLVYDEMPTITVEKTDYREKSPFSIRGWYLCGRENYDVYPTEVMMSRNKLNASYAPNVVWGSFHESKLGLGLNPIISGHNIKSLLLNSPLYDPEIEEYWNTSPTGEYGDQYSSRQINFWSDLCVDAIAATIMKLAEDSSESGGLQYIAINPEDFILENQYPEDTQPYEYAPGQFVDPTDENYLSTVVISFVNKVARKVGEKYPDLTITTYAYNIATIPPACELEDNVAVEFCTFSEDSSTPIYEPKQERSQDMWDALNGWMEKTDNIFLYTYYACYIPAPYYGRPMWYTMQKDLQFYAENNFVGLCPQGWVDDEVPFAYDTNDDGTHSYYTVGGSAIHTYGDAWSMNELFLWLYNKLLWNPYDDVDALIAEFCHKCYGDAAPYMQEYYRLLVAGMEEGKEELWQQFNEPLRWGSYLNVYLDYFLLNPDFEENPNLMGDVLTNLKSAWDAADDKEKERIKYIKEMMEYLNETYG